MKAEFDILSRVTPLYNAAFRHETTDLDISDHI